MHGHSCSLLHKLLLRTSLSDVAWAQRGQAPRALIAKPPWEGVSVQASD